MRKKEQERRSIVEAPESRLPQCSDSNSDGEDDDDRLRATFSYKSVKQSYHPSTITAIGEGEARSRAAPTIRQNSDSNDDSE